MQSDPNPTQLTLNVLSTTITKILFLVFLTQSVSWYIVPGNVEAYSLFWLVFWGAQVCHDWCCLGNLSLG